MLSQQLIGAINLLIMTELEKYKAVNSTKSLKELANVIRSFADEDGDIQGTTRKLPVEFMAIRSQEFIWECQGSLTKAFGIRQQAMMLLFNSEN